MTGTVSDLSEGLDVRGDMALFIDANHFSDQGWKLDFDIGPEAKFFRVISNGGQLSNHGWAKHKEVIQWG